MVLVVLKRLFEFRRFGLRNAVACLLVLAPAFIFARNAVAQSNPAGVPDPTVAIAEKFSLDQPAHLTPRALSGLFTAVARAGNRLVAVGERGRVIVSDDNGATWRQVATPSSVTLTDVAFATPLDGWAVGDMGLVLHSSDGGMSWTKQLDGAQAASLALAAAQSDIKQSGSNPVTIANLQSAQAMVATGPSVPFLNVAPLSASNVMIAGAFGMAFSSTDGGDHWQSLADLLPNPNGLHVYQVLADGSNIAVVGEQGLVLYGPAAKPLATLATPFQGTFFGETFTHDHAWIIFGLQGTILRSTDQGAHWASIAAGEAVGIDCGIVLQDGDVVLGNVAGQLLTSHDDGQSFTVTPVDEPVVGLAQAPGGAVIAVGPNGPQSVSLATLGAGV